MVSIPLVIGTEYLHLLLPHSHAHAYRFPQKSVCEFCSAEQLLDRWDELGIAKGVVLPIVNPEVYLPQSNEDILEMAEKYPDQYAFKYPTLDYTRTYEEFREDVDNFARALVSMGVKPGSKVAIWATNVPAWYITFWATTKIGAVLVTVNTAYKIHEAEYLLRQSDTHTLVMIDSCLDSNYAQIINELCPEIASAKPGEANRLYEYFISLVEKEVKHTGHGEFGADMQVSLVNDGPVTICIDTKNKE